MSANASARKSHVHPARVDLARNREARAAWRDRLHLPRAKRWLNRYERGLIAFLEGMAAHHQPRKAT